MHNAKMKIARASTVHFVDDYLPALLAQASHLISGEFHLVVTGNGFSVSEWRVLATLAANEPMSIGRIAQITSLFAGKTSTVRLGRILQHL